MYVCVCNAYREAHVRDAIKKSGGNSVTVEQLYARLGKSLRCGRCVNHVQGMIQHNREITAGPVCDRPGQS